MILTSLGIDNLLSVVVIYASAPCMLHLRFLIITQGPKPTWRGKGVLVAYSLSSKKPGQELKGTRQRQEPKQSLREATHSPAFHGFAQLHVSYSPGPVCGPGVVLLTVDWTLPHPSLIRGYPADLPTKLRFLLPR